MNISPEQAHLMLHSGDLCCYEGEDACSVLTALREQRRAGEKARAWAHREANYPCPGGMGHMRDCTLRQTAFLAGHAAARAEALEEAAKMVCGYCRSDEIRLRVSEWPEGYFHSTIHCTAEPIHRELARLWGKENN